MKRFSITADIAAPPERVWQVMSDVTRWHEWTPSITSVKLLGDKPFAVGTQALVRQPKLPPALWKVASISPERSFTWVSSAPGLRVVGHHSVEPHGTGSRITLGIDMDGLFSGLLAQLTGGITQRYIEMEAKGLDARSRNPLYRHADRD